ncbi:MAG: mechanosensitive ion channel family protein [Lachnospiraceae bacterium]|nr:mechanosensitive ion channel family protein [Lachnospiraceae bacterium]
MILLSGDTAIDTEKIQDVAQSVTEKAIEAVPEDVTEKISLFQKYMDQLPEKAMGLGIRIVLAVITLIIGIWVIRIIRKILKHSLQKAKADKGVTQFLDSFVKAVLTILLIFMIATNFGVDAASIVAILGSMGVAISLALQGSLSNFAGGVLILLLKPFKVGDYIQENSHGNEGTVTEIQLFYTKLVTRDLKTVVLPNGVLANTSLVNFSALPFRRVDLKVGISYDADLKKAKKVAEKVLKEHDLVVEEKPISVYVSDLEDSCVSLGMFCHVKTEDFLTARGQLLEQVKLAFDEKGIHIPYPQMDVHVKSQA